MEKIILTPVGDFEANLIQSVGTEIAKAFGFPVEVNSLLLEMDYALDPMRNQYYSTLILEKLCGLAPPHALKILALVQVDLFIPIMTHVYGEAQLGGRACILSTYRLRDGLSPVNAAEVFLQRVVKEALHELGHTFSLRHCPEQSCLMHYCRSQGEVDRRSTEFCRYCKVLLNDQLKRQPGTLRP